MMLHTFCVASLGTSNMLGGFTNLWKAFQSETEQLPYHIEMQFVSMLSMVQLTSIRVDTVVIESL